MILKAKDIDEIRQFIVDSNLEFSLINQLNNPTESKERIIEWLGWEE
jgi:hypothetical protein